MESRFGDLRIGRYISLTTYRRDGTGVSTPVWCAVADGRLYVQTGRDSGKAKRIRRESEVAVAPCRARGAPTGPSMRGHARILELERAAADTGARLLRRKYGWQKRIALYLAARRGEATVILEIVPA
jgi:uncharacterized protein